MYRQSLCANFERKSSSGDNCTDTGYADSILGDTEKITDGYLRPGSTCDNDDDTESVISLMSCQSISPSIQQHSLQNRMISPPYISQFRKNINIGGNGLNMIPENTLRRNDFKRHSLTSLRKFPNGVNSKGSAITDSSKDSCFSNRSSMARRSMINPRFNVNRMSAIEEFSRM